MVKIFCGGISCVGKDSLIKPLINYIENKGIEYFHFGNEMKKYYPKNKKSFLDLSFEEKETARNLTFEEIKIKENLFVNGHYLIPNYNFKKDKIESFSIFYEKLELFNKYLLVESDLELIINRRVKRDNILFEKNIINYELDKNREIFESISKQQGYVINNSKSINESSNELLKIIKGIYNLN